MTSNRRGIIVVLILGLLGLLMYIIVSMLGNDVLKYQWYESYNYNKEQPYDVSIFYRLLDGYFENESFETIKYESVSQFLKPKTNDSLPASTYIFVGDYSYHTEKDYKVLESYMKAGNTVFWISGNSPYDLFAAMNRDCGWDDYYDSENFKQQSIRTDFINPNLRDSTVHRAFYEWGGEKSSYYWDYVPDTLCGGELEIEPLGFIGNKSYTNFARMQVGEGQLILHSNPLFFTNLLLLEEDMAIYASKMLSHVPEGEIYWDEYSKIWTYRQDYEGNEDSTPFTYILQQRSFKWAFYTIWILVFIFLLFNLWRKQRAIPVKFKNKNTSLEFMKTVGELYFNNRNNKRLARQKMEYFLKMVRMKYYIKERNEEKLISLLAKKSEVNIQQIEQIFSRYKRIKSTRENIDDDTLSRFYRDIESFHKKSK